MKQIANMRCNTVHIYVVNMIYDPLFFAVCNISLYHELMKYPTVMHYTVTKGHIANVYDIILKLKRALFLVVQLF